MEQVQVHDPMQPKYTYVLTEPIGKNFAAEFTPALSPQQMLELGIFGGNYFGGHIGEYPKEWFKNAVLSEVADPQLNFFKVGASKPLTYWQQKGWIHPQDPRGWFQWYCRYVYGRRSEDDERQIKRWKAFKRHQAQVRKHCFQGDFSCRPKQRQALLHWAYDSRTL